MTSALGTCFCMPPMKWRKASVLLAFVVGEDVLAVFLSTRDCCDMHSRARLALDGFCHEGRVGVVLERRFADGALEHEHLVGELDRIAVAQVDLELSGASSWISVSISRPWLSEKW